MCANFVKQVQKKDSHSKGNISEAEEEDDPSEGEESESEFS